MAFSIDFPGFYQRFGASRLLSETRWSVEWGSGSLDRLGLHYRGWRSRMKANWADVRADFPALDQEVGKDDDQNWPSSG